MNDTIVVEFSANQQAFHKSTLMEMIKNNINNIFAGKKTDYLPVGFFKTDDEADNFIKIIRDKFVSNNLFQ